MKKIIITIELITLITLIIIFICVDNKPYKQTNININVVHDDDNLYGSKLNDTWETYFIK